MAISVVCLIARAPFQFYCEWLPPDWNPCFKRPAKAEDFASIEDRDATIFDLIFYFATI